MEGESLGAVADALAETGLEREAALEIAKASQVALRDDDFKSQIREAKLEHSGPSDGGPMNDIVWGLIWGVGGTAVTLVTIESGFGVVFFGAIIYGIYRVLKGFARMIG